MNREARGPRVPLNTLNIYFWALENFLGTSEVEEFSQNEQNLKSSFEISRWIFEKFFNNVFFLASKLVYASYDHKN